MTRWTTTVGWMALVAMMALAPAAWGSPEVPGRTPAEPVALVGGTIHPIDGPVVERGTLVFHQGRIVALGTDVSPPENAQRIDVTGKHIYPGLFDAHSDLGLVEIDSVRATRDQAETGQINPNVRAQVAFNPDSELIPVARSNGVLLAVSAPSGGLLSGSSAVMQLDGWTWEEMTIRGGAGMMVNWPAAFHGEGLFGGGGDRTDAENRQQQIRALRQAIADARAYGAALKSSPAEPPEHDARWEALQPVLAGAMPLVVNAESAIDIQSAVAFAVAEKLKIVILGGADAAECADLLKQYDVPVIVEGTHRLPRRAAEAYDDAYTLPARLHEAGVRFCISGSESAWNLRNLPYQAATAAAYGLPAEEALKAITLTPAQIMGVSDRVGSLKPGKDATLFVSSGDPLEITSQVELAFIAGRAVDLSDRHKRLWHKYRQKYQPAGASGAPVGK